MAHADIVRMLISNVEAQLNCPICLELLDAPLYLPCDHIMCGQCAQRTLQEYGRCPICKAPATLRSAQPNAMYALIVEKFIELRQATLRMVETTEAARACGLAAESAGESPSTLIAFDAPAAAEPGTAADERDEDSEIANLEALGVRASRDSPSALAPLVDASISTAEVRECIARNKAAQHASYLAMKRAEERIYKRSVPHGEGGPNDVPPSPPVVLVPLTPCPGASQPAAQQGAGVEGAAAAAAGSAQGGQGHGETACAHDDLVGAAALGAVASAAAAEGPSAGGAAGAGVRAGGAHATEQRPPAPPVTRQPAPAVRLAPGSADALEARAVCLHPGPTAASAAASADPAASAAGGGVRAAQPALEGAAAGAEDDELCCVCGSGDSEPDNLIVFCARCELAVHQVCYAVGAVPDGDWLCDRCQLPPADADAVRCAVCPSTRGAFKRTDRGRWGGWMHVLCAQWVPELGFKRAASLEGAAGVDLVHRARLNLSCTFCDAKAKAAHAGGSALHAPTPATPACSSGSAKGKGRARPHAPPLPDGRVSVCVQCSLGKCVTAFHASCAQEAGCFMRIDEAPGGKDELLREVLCLKHTALRKKADLEGARAAAQLGGSGSGGGAKRQKKSSAT